MNSIMTVMTYIMNELLSRWSSPTGPPGLTELIYHDEREVSKNPASNNHVGSKNRNLSGRIRIS
jgi:hypothetical protein